jgi:FkbM family methyltransferase
MTAAFPAISLRTKAAVKSAVRKVVRRLGYDVVPLVSSWSELQRTLLADVDLVVDVGANTGQYADKMRSLGYWGPLVSFEPGSAAFRVLSRRARPDATWSVHNVALGRTVGESLLHVSENSVSSSVLPVMEEHLLAAPRSLTVATEKVLTTTLDDVLAPYPGAALWLKMDVQGFESEVLSGGSLTLRRTRVIQCELSLRPLYEDQADYLQLINDIREAGFDLVHVEPGYQEPSSGQCLQIDGLFVRR